MKFSKPKIVFSNNFKKFSFSIYILTVLAISVIYIINLFIYEINLSYTVDSPMYCAVARGMLNGITPYSGLYENKPICVFLLHALSFFLTDSIIVVNIFSCLCLLVIAFMPVICILRYMKKENNIFSNYKIIIYSSVALLSGILIMEYSLLQGDYFQTEIIGAGFICLYFWAIMHINWKKGQKVNKKSLVLWTSLSAIFAMCGVMTKEPFAIIAVVGGLFLTESIRDFISKVVIPMCLGAVFAIILLFATGTLSAYFGIYIKNMFGNHISYYGSPFERMLDVKKLIYNLLFYQPYLLVILLICIVLIIIFLLFKKTRNSLRIWKISTLIIAIFATSFTVGLGGQYFNHHFIFATPIYILFLIEGCKIATELFNGKESKIAFTFFVIIFFCYANNVNYFTTPPFEKSVLSSTLEKNTYRIALEQAEYVDALLDYYNEDTYQFLGFNQTSVFYGLTKHSPKGPVFVQDSYNFEDENNWFSQNLLKQIDEVNIIILYEFNIPILNDKVQKILDTEFTTEPKNKFTEIKPPTEFKNYTIYYRINTH